MHWLRDLTSLLLAFFYHHELLALALILLPEEAGVPMPPPGYALLIIAGAEPGRSLFSALSVVAVAASASFAGSYFTFYLTRRFGRETLLKWAHRLRVKQSRIEQMQRWMERYGRAGIFAGRLVPGLRVPTIFVAGLTGMRMATFAIIDAGCRAHLGGWLLLAWRPAGAKVGADTTGGAGDEPAVADCDCGEPLGAGDFGRRVVLDQAPA